eukprot:gene3955-biopygen20358
MRRASCRRRRWCRRSSLCRLGGSCGRGSVALSARRSIHVEQRRRDDAALAHAGADGEGLGERAVEPHLRLHPVVQRLQHLQQPGRDALLAEHDPQARAVHDVEGLAQVDEDAVQRAAGATVGVVDERAHEADAVRRAAARAEPARGLVEHALGDLEAEVTFRLGERDHDRVAPRRGHLAVLPAREDQLEEAVAERCARAAQRSTTT